MIRCQQHLRMIVGLSSLICLIFFNFTASFAGDIQGRVEILQAPRSQQEAASPWARSRNLEGTEAVEPIGDEILAVIYLEANSWLDAK
jgi:hypothetical protein